jgi:hypothetical protein
MALYIPRPPSAGPGPADTYFLLPQRLAHKDIPEFCRKTDNWGLPCAILARIYRPVLCEGSEVGAVMGDGDAAEGCGQ